MGLKCVGIFTAEDNMILRKPNEENFNNNLIIVYNVYFKI